MKILIICLLLASQLSFSDDVKNYARIVFDDPANGGCTPTCDAYQIMPKYVAHLDIKPPATIPLQPAIGDYCYFVMLCTREIQPGKKAKDCKQDIMRSTNVDKRCTSTGIMLDK